MVIDLTAIIVLLVMRYYPKSAIFAFLDVLLFGSTRFALDVIINSILTEKYNDELEIINSAFRVI